MSNLKKFLSTALVMSTLLSNLAVPTYASDVKPPVAEEEYEYYQIRSAYTEIHPYPNYNSKTYGVPSNPNSSDINSFVGQNQSEALSTYDKRDNWGNHAAVTVTNQTLPTTMPDGAIVTGIEWIKPLVNGVELGNGVPITDAYTQVYEAYKNYYDNGGKNEPFNWSLATPGKKAIVIERDPSGFMPQWQHEASLMTNLAYTTPDRFLNTVEMKGTSSYNVVQTNISAKEPGANSGNRDGKHWTKKEQVSNSMYNDAMEIRAHWKYGHGIELGKDLTYEQLQKYNYCKLTTRTVHANGGSWEETYCAVDGNIDDSINKFSNPVRKDSSFKIEDDFSNLSEKDKLYYKYMPGGTYQTETFYYGTANEPPKRAWRTAWSKSYIVGGDNNYQNKAFADMFNGNYSPNREEYRTYTPYLVKFKVKVPPTNLKMPYNVSYGVNPNKATFEDGYLHIRPVAVLDAHKSNKAKVPAQITLTVKNRTNPGTNEFSGTIPYQELELKKPINYMDKITKPIQGSGMKPIVGKDTLDFKIEQTDREQELYIRMEVNPENVPQEPERKDNVWETIVKIPANNVDLIAQDIEVEATNPTPDWGQICTNILLTTAAKGTANNQVILNKYPTSDVKAEIWVDGAQRKDLTKETRHQLHMESMTNTVYLCLPNDPNKPGYNVKVKLVINENRNQPPGEKTYNNNIIEETFFIPTIKKPEEPPKKEDIEDPELILPMYDEESYKCYLPKNTKTGQREQILYSIGSMTHTHMASAVSWEDASGNRVPPAQSLKELNWGKPLSWGFSRVHGWHCPDEDSNVPDCCYQYIRDNQKATGFSWWDKNDFQRSRGATQTVKYEAPILKLAIETRTVRDHEICNSDCCYGYGTGHMHDTEERTGTSYCSSKDCEGHEYTYTVCVGRAPSHYHSHTEYSVSSRTSVRLEHNIRANNPSAKTVDHATGEKWTRAGYGIYSTLNYSYTTDLKTPNRNCCSWGAEAYLFMPHLNKELPHRIVPMEAKDNSSPFPRSFQTAENKKSLQNYRKQFVDVDYPDKNMVVHYRYKLKAPGFEPTKYPTSQEQRLKSMFPHANAALGACVDDSIRIEGNMWDDVWVHPDDPVPVRQP